MQESHTGAARPLDAGQQVNVRDEPWVVLGADRFEAVRLVHLRGIGDGNRDELRSFVSPFDVIHTSASPTRLRQSSRRRALAAAASTIADTASWAECWTAASARIDLHAWQLEPAIAAVNGATRILLADHVGLGKTIQATLIVSELRARRLAHRVLVLTPASLREQWASEMRERFGLTPTVVDQGTLHAMVSSLPVGVNPWLTAPLIVSSIDLVKRPEVRAAIDRVAFDVVIVDEAHHVTRTTDRGALVAEIASRTPWVVLVTATPHSGDEAAFAFLHGLGRGNKEPLLTFRRRRPSLDRRTARRSRMLMVTPTSAERVLLEAVTAYVRAVKRAAHSDGAALVAAVIARRASSCAQAAKGTLRRRAALLSRAVEPEPQPLLPWEDAEAADAELDDVALGTAGLANVRDEVAWLERLASLADQATAHSSKVAILRRLLTRTSEQLLVFTEYRDVAQHLTSALDDATSVVSLHGGLSPRERRAVVDSFNQGGVRTLVATDAAGEGLNLHYRCRLVVNLELPWTPRRLEQRIGRVDRLGQPKRVHAIHLVHRHSFEGTVVRRLERRRATIRARTSDSPVVDRQTGVSVQRRLRMLAKGIWKANPESGVYAPRCRAGARDSALVLVYAANVVDSSGRVVRKLVAPIAVTAWPDRLTSRTLARRMVRSLSMDPAIRSAVHDRFSRQTSELSARMATVVAALDRRISVCLEAIDRRRADVVWQGSLFDAHVDHAAHLQTTTLADMRAHLMRMQNSTSALAALHVSEPCLAAAWIGD